MERHGLKRGQNGLEIYVMCEIPNNGWFARGPSERLFSESCRAPNHPHPCPSLPAKVILIDEFSKLYDGFSIGSNDLTQLTLGVDRDSAIVTSFDERDPGVKKMIQLAVEGCKRNKRHSGICGQAPSDYPEMAEFVVKVGIDSMSLTPDSVMKTTLAVRALEEKLGFWDEKGGEAKVKDEKEVDGMLKGTHVEEQLGAIGDEVANGA